MHKTADVGFSTSAEEDAIKYLSVKTPKIIIADAEIKPR